MFRRCRVVRNPFIPPSRPDPTRSPPVKPGDDSRGVWCTYVARNRASSRALQLCHRPIRMGQMHYLPLSAPFFAFLVGAFLVVLALIQIGILRYAYLRIGISSGWAMVLLLGSLIGSYINIPIAQLPEREVQSGARRQLLRHAIRGADGGRMAGHGDRGQCRRRGDSGAAVALSAVQERDVDQRRHRDRDRHRDHPHARLPGRRRRHRRAGVRAAGRHRPRRAADRPRARARRSPMLPAASAH